MAATVTEAKRKPGWMSIPGGPKEPNVQEYRAKFSALVDEKKACFEKLKQIRAEFDAARGADTKDESQAERAALREKIAKIDAERKKEREARRGTDERIKAIREERRAIEETYQRVVKEVGAFQSVEEIDAAIEHVMYKLETGGSASVKAEKETIKKLNKLEEAKSLLLKLDPLNEAIADFEEKELDLRQESREVHSRIAELNSEFEAHLQLKMQKDSERKKSTVDYGALHKRRETVSAKIDELNKKIDELKAGFDEAQEAWKKWRVEAQEKYQAKIDAERAERERVWREREEQRKRERRIARAAKKMNPHKHDIERCTDLVAFFDVQVKNYQRRVQEAERRLKLATFDPAVAAPQGMTLSQKSDDDWLFGDRTSKPKKQKPKGATARVDAPSVSNRVQIDEKRMSALERLGVHPPATFDAVPETIKILQDKKKEFESKIIASLDQVGDVTSSDDEAAAAEEGADDATVVASTAAPTAAA